MDQLASISRILRREREPSLYGDEETGMIPEELYVASDAEKALNDAETVLRLVVKLLEQAPG